MSENKHSITNQIQTLAKKYYPVIQKLYEQLHQIPELGWDLFKTSALVQSELKKLAIPFQLINKTGIIATIKFKKPGKVLLSRADMDA